MAGERNRSLRLALLGLVLIAAATFLAYRLPAPAAADAAAFSAQRAQALLEQLIGDNRPHPMGSAANTALREALIAHLRGLGYTVETQSGLVCSNYGTCGSPTNIIAYRSQPAADDLVLLAAHYDSVPAGPGASDDFVGVVTLLDIARLLAQQPAHRHPVVLLLSDGEEAGMLGASLFVRSHPLAWRVRAAVNLEARGTSGPSLMFETGAANDWLMGLYRRAVQRPISDSLFYIAYRALPNNTDFSVFKAAGIEGFNLALVRDVGHYHTPLDSAANTRLASIQHQGDNAFAALTALADAASIEHPPGDAVFFDVFSRVLVQWSVPVSLGAAVLALVLLMVIAAVLTTRGEIDTGELLWGLLATVLALLAAALFAGVALWLSRLTRNVGPSPAFSWISQPQGMHLVSGALALLALAACAGLVARRTRFAATWLAVSLVGAALFCVTAAWLPGASFVVGLPTVAAALAGTLLLRTAPGNAALGACVLAPLWIGWTVMLPVIGLQYDALGSVGWVFETFLITLATLPLLVLLVQPAAREWRRRFLAAGGICTLGGLGFTLMMPVYSADWPLRLNIEYRLDADQHRAWWVAEPNAARLPAPVLAAAAFEPKPRPRLPGMQAARAFFAPAPLRELPAPQLTAVCGEPGTRHHLHVQSARGAPRALVIFSPDSGVHEAIFATANGEQRVPLVRGYEGTGRLDLPGLAPGGLDFDVQASGAVRAHVLDVSYELSGAQALQDARGEEAIRSQDGDVTVVQLTVDLCPASGR